MRISDWSSDVCSSDLALRACGGLGQVQHCFARAVIDGDVLGLDRAAVPAGGAAGAADRRPDRGFGVAGHGHVAQAPAVHGRLQVVARVGPDPGVVRAGRSEEHTSELQYLMRISYAVFCLYKTKRPRNLQYKKTPQS